MYWCAVVGTAHQEIDLTLAMEGFEDHDRDTKHRVFAATASLLLVVAVRIAYVYGQKGIKPLTKDEQLQLRNLEVSATNAESELHKTKEYQAFMEAQKNLQEGATSVFTKRKISMSDYTICDGDAAPICAGVAKGSLELRPIPKPNAQKK
jgi:flagellar hook-length control protein FliK